ncbi:MAG: truA [Chitinophagaceae bacterium]|nr:truA [Chitinophagaceae bacterium]
MRYFLEVAYKGTGFSGFQIQENSRTIQGAVESALLTIFREKMNLTGSSRTDSGVHALQNYFHFDTELVIDAQQLYNLNAVLPPEIAVRSIRQVKNDAHCRFSAGSREYVYYIYKDKNPFKKGFAWYYPYKLDINLLQEAAQVVMNYENFSSFSKRNTQVKTFICTIEVSVWKEDGESLAYYIKANRFLRGMVRALVATMLKVGRGTISLDEFKTIIQSGNNSLADFSAPPDGLFLKAVNFPQDFFG